MLNLSELKLINNLLKNSESQNEIIFNLIEKINKEIDEAENYNECLWSFFWDCGRQGVVEGIFKSTKQEVEEAMGNYISFGEILGKHSEVYGNLEHDDIKLISDDPIVVLNSVSNGYNPLEYAQYECTICESNYPRDEFKDFKNKICEYCCDNKGE